MLSGVRPFSRGEDPRTILRPQMEDWVSWLKQEQEMHAGKWLRMEFGDDSEEARFHALWPSIAARIGVFPEPPPQRLLQEWGEVIYRRDAPQAVDWRCYFNFHSAGEWGLFALTLWMRWTQRPSS